MTWYKLKVFLCQLRMIKVYMGESVQLQYAILPENTTYKTVKLVLLLTSRLLQLMKMVWLPSQELIDAITETVTITASALDGSQVYASKQLTIMKVVQA